MHKGFTLVELLAVIAILAILALITATILGNIMSSSRESLYETNINTIEDAAKKWSVEHRGAMPQVTGSCNIQLQTMVDDNFLNNKAINDPRKNSATLSGCVEVTYDDVRNKYSYEYKENDCSSNICTE